MFKLKFVAGLFLVSTILSLNNVKADSYLGFSGITIPSMQGVYTTSSIVKKTQSEQYVKKISAIDKLSGDERAIGARLNNITTYYVQTVKGSYVQLFSSNSSLGVNPGSYKLDLKASKWTASSALFSGGWILDDYLL